MIDIDDVLNIVEKGCKPWYEECKDDQIAVLLQLAIGVIAKRAKRDDIVEIVRDVIQVPYGWCFESDEAELAFDTLSNMMIDKQK